MQEQITLFGDLVVNGKATITSYDASVQLRGAIRAGTEQAKLHLIGNDTFDFRGSIRLEKSKSLAVIIDGESAPLAMTDVGNSLAGSGTYIGDIAVSNGASIAPGESPGKLTIVGDTMIGTGANYNWEIASIVGTPGETWDLLHVEGDLRFAATKAAPWALQISAVPGFMPGQAQPWLIASADSITGFDPAAVRFDVSGITGVWPPFTSNALAVFTQGGNLFLQIIPEPTLSLLIVAGIAAAEILRRQKVRR